MFQLAPPASFDMFNRFFLPFSLLNPRMEVASNVMVVLVDRRRGV
jgi:hypothetical protein